MEKIQISQTVAILVDGNNIERSLLEYTKAEGTMLDFEKVIPKIVADRQLNRLIYFREGRSISSKLAERLHDNFHGSVRPCHKSADIPLSIRAVQLASKVDTIVIMSGDSDFIELVKHLKSEGVRVEVAAVEQTTSGELLKEADFYWPIGEGSYFVHKSNRKRGPNGG